MILYILYDIIMYYDIIYGSTVIVNVYSFSAGIGFRRQNMTSIELRF